MYRISEDEKRRILGLFYQGNSRRRIADVVRHSSATVHRVITTHERNVSENGLIYELSEEGLSEPIELARLNRELQRDGVSVNDCRDAIPIVRRCRELGVEEDAVNELIDAAVTLGGPEFPREQFAQSLLRILRREQETGQTIEQVETAHHQLSSETDNLRSEATTLRNNINRLTGQGRQIDAHIRSSQEQLKSLEDRLARIPITEAALARYQTDRNFLAPLGLNMDDPSKAAVALVQLASMDYNPTDIVGELVRVLDLNMTVSTLTTRVSGIQTSITALTQQRDNLTKEIQELENKRQQVRETVQKEEADAQEKIKESKTRVINQLFEQNVTERQLADYVAAREALGEGGVPL